MNWNFDLPTGQSVKTGIPTQVQSGKAGIQAQLPAGSAPATSELSGQDDDDTTTVRSQPLPRDAFRIRQYQKARASSASQTGSVSYGNAFSDLRKTLNLPSNARVFVVDSHRPIHLCNLSDQNDVVVVLFTKEDEGQSDLSYDFDLTTLANAATTVNSDFDSESEFESDSNSGSERLSDERYHDGVMELEQHINSSGNLDMVTSVTLKDGTKIRAPNSLRITYENQPRLMLLQEWSLFDSMMCSSYIATKLKMWSENRIKKLKLLFGTMGFALGDC
ncbi:hypothetical protein JHK82_012192 [Glycine max]|nr:hypothetical protein JHK82_012192 [Glycine max]